MATSQTALESRLAASQTALELRLAASQADLKQEMAAAQAGSEKNILDQMRANNWKQILAISSATVAALGIFQAFGSQ